MGSVLCCLAAVTMGVEVGWQRLPDGGVEYVIQIEPEMLELLKEGEDYASDIPRGLRDVRSYRITVGTGPLPREGGLERELDDQRGRPSLPPAGSEVERSAERPAAGSGGSPFGPASPSEPQTITPPGDVKPMPNLREKAAVYFEPSAIEPSTSPTEEHAREPQKTEPPRPWTALVLAWALSFGTTGGMLYAGWIAWEYRRRYRGLLEKMVGVGEDATTHDAADWHLRDEGLGTGD
jgi:hypothetical protein